MCACVVPVCETNDSVSFVVVSLILLYYGTRGLGNEIVWLVRYVCTASRRRCVPIGY